VSSRWGQRAIGYLGHITLQAKKQVIGRLGYRLYLEGLPHFLNNRYGLLIKEPCDILINGLSKESRVVGGGQSPQYFRLDPSRHLPGLMETCQVLHLPGRALADPTAIPLCCSFSQLLSVFFSPCSPTSSPSLRDATISISTLHVKKCITSSNRSLCSTGELEVEQRKPFVSGRRHLEKSRPITFQVICLLTTFVP
jgi:hypothetical protein